MAMAKAVHSRRDRWADWLVIGVVAVALSLGWGIKAWTEGGTERFTSPETGLTLHYPTGWLMSRADGYLLKVRDPHSGLFKTTYAVMADRLDPARPMSLVDAVNATSVSRARKLTAFRLLDIETVGEDNVTNCQYKNKSIEIVRDFGNKKTVSYKANKYTGSKEDTGFIGAQKLITKKDVDSVIDWLIEKEAPLKGIKEQIESTITKPINIDK